MTYWVAGSAIGGALLSTASSADATERAADALAGSTQQSIEQQRGALERARADLQPFREAGESALPGLTSLIGNPEAQRSLITDNQFLKSLTGEAGRRLDANPVTATTPEAKKALENSLLLLGDDFVAQSIGQRQNLATLGANAAAGQATGTLQTGRSISDLLTEAGNVEAARAVASSNIQNQALEDILSNIGSVVNRRNNNAT